MAEEVNGIINVYKEAGFTSHDVVAKLRGFYIKKRSAIQEHWIRGDGVLPVCCGKATRCVNCLPIKKKVYGQYVNLEL